MQIKASNEKRARPLIKNVILKSKSHNWMFMKQIMEKLHYFKESQLSLPYITCQIIFIAWKRWGKLRSYFWLAKKPLISKIYFSMYFSDYLKDNNEKMKVQYRNLSAWKEKIRVNNERNKEKFDQTKEVVQTLTRDNETLQRDVDTKVTTAKCQCQPQKGWKL